MRGLFLFQGHPSSGRPRGGVLRGYGYWQPERQDIQGHRVTMAVALFYVVAKTMEQKHHPLVIYQNIREDNDAVGRLIDRSKFDLFRYQY